MFRNFIKIALRNISKQKLYSAINVAGLVVSISSCIFIAIYVQYEFSYDTFNSKADRIYKMAVERKYPNHITYYSPVPHSFASVAMRDFPEVKNTLRVVVAGGNSIVNYQKPNGETVSFDENYFVLADTSFFSFLDLKLIKGDRRTVLSKPNEIVLTQSAARKYFGNQDPLDKILSGDLDGEFKVVGVCEDMPENSHIKFNMVGSLITNPFYFTHDNDFASFYTHVYFELQPNADVKQLEAKFPKMVDTYASGEIERELNMSWADYKKAGNGYTYFLQPLSSIHLDPLNLEYTLTPAGNVNYLYVLIFIAFLILTISCINFMNMATVRSTERAKEVGVRKVVGSSKRSLVIQFLVESVIICIVSTIIAVVLVYSMMPRFNSLIDRQLVFNPDLYMIAALIAVPLLVGALAGLYPAFVLSGYSPVVVLKGRFIKNSKGVWLRNALVVFQFTISIILIVSTIVIEKQMKYIQEKELGFDKNNVLLLERTYSLGIEAQPFMNEIRRIVGVQSVAGVSSVIGAGDTGAMFLSRSGNSEVLTVKTMVMDEDFAGTIGFDFVEGRGFSKNANDSSALILNEVAVKTLGLKDAVGQRLVNSVTRDDGTVSVKEYTVVGVVKDFHFQSLRDEITPLVIQNSKLFGGTAYIAVRFENSKVSAVVNQIEKEWRSKFPSVPFKYNFLDEDMARQYSEEKRSGRLFSIFSNLAIIIACVGLFGLSTYTTSVRSKELGIRKVLGATVPGLLINLSSDFTRLVLFALVLAAPCAWWMMDEWLQGFAYHTSMGVMPFIIAGILSLVITWITVSYQSLKVALVNPLKHLRSE